MSSDAEEVLAKLLALSRIDRKIRRLDQELERAPAAVASRRETVKGLESKAAALEGKVKLLRAQMRVRESEVRAYDMKIEKLKEQASAVRSNKEFMAFKSELSNAQADSDRIQGEVLKVLTVVEQADARIAALRSQRDAETTKADEAQAAAEAKLGQVREQRSALQAERDEAAKALPKEAFQMYDRVHRARGNGLAMIEGGYCGGCGAMLTRNDVYAVENRSRLVPCKNCNRLIVKA